MGLSRQSTASVSSNRQRSGDSLKITMEGSLLSHPERRLRLRRTLRQVRPAVAIMLAYAAWELLPVWLPYFWALVPRPAQRMIVNGFLNGLMAGYAAALVLVAGGLGLLSLTLIRNPRRLRGRPRLARFLLLGVSLSISLAGLELVSAAMMGWLHRAPTLPQVEAGAGPAHPVCSRGGDDGRQALADPGHRRIECAWRAVSADPFHGADRGLAARARPARAAGPGGHAGRVRGHPGRDAPEAGRPHLPAGRCVALLRAQRIREPFHLEAEHQVLRGRAVAHARDDHARVCLAVVAVLPADPGDPGAAAIGCDARSGHQAAARRSAGMLAAGAGRHRGRLRGQARVDRRVLRGHRHASHLHRPGFE